MNKRREYLRCMASPQWEARRSAYFAKHRKRCAACGSKDDVQLHHRTYERMGRELDADLCPLCQRCHASVHDHHRLVRGSLAVATDLVVQRIRSKSKRKVLARAVIVGRRHLLIDKFSARAAQDREARAAL
jgi:5-methylcytosine-specific restriction endonuclease McrA